MNIQQHNAIFCGILLLALAGNHMVLCQIYCEAGEYFNSELYSDSTVPPCLLCPAGKFSPTACVDGEICDGISRCEECLAGKYSAEGASTCTDCAAGSDSSAGAATCACGEGFTGGGTSESPCTQCEPGTYKDVIGSGDCLVCNDNAVSNADFTGCDCNNGYEYSGSICTSCAAGTYYRHPVSYSEAYSNQICTQSIGNTCLGMLCDHYTYVYNLYYQSTAATGAKDTCKEICDSTSGCNGVYVIFTWQRPVPLIWSFQCVLCANQQASNPTDFGDIQNPKTYEWYNHVLTPGGGCLPCDSGKYSSNTAASICIDCLSGTFEDGSRTVCTLCPDFSSSPAASDDVEDCECQSDYYGSHGGSCSQCPDNTGVLVTGGANIDSCICNSGYYGIDGGPCNPCYQNSAVPIQDPLIPGKDDAASCICNQGYFGPAGGPCTSDVYKCGDGQIWSQTAHRYAEKNSNFICDVPIEQDFDAVPCYGGDVSHCSNAIEDCKSECNNNQQCKGIYLVIVWKGFKLEDGTDDTTVDPEISSKRCVMCADQVAMAPTDFGDFGENLNANYYYYLTYEWYDHVYGTCADCAINTYKDVYRCASCLTKGKPSITDVEIMGDTDYLRGTY